MKIGLIGFSFTHENKGCEALTYSMLSILRKVCEDKKIEIVNFSSCKDLGEVPKIFSEFEFKSFEVKLKDLKLNYMKEFNSCDAVFDVTFGDGFSDIYFLKPMYKNVLIKWLAGISRSKFVLAPQTYGPFNSKMLEVMAAIAIRKADFVYSRDVLSANYVKKISNRDITVVTDLAFALPYEQPVEKMGGKHIGLNISGLLWKGGFSSENQFGLKVNYREYCTKIVKYLLENTDYDIHLISHVTYASDKDKKILDSDIDACKAVKEIFAGEERVKSAPIYENPISIKNYISKMEYFIGARMHATIGAFSSGVKTIPFAYSRKFQGLYENLGYSYYIDGTKISTDEAVGTTIDYLKKEKELSQCAAKAMEEIESNMNVFEKEIRKILFEE